MKQKPKNFIIPLIIYPFDVMVSMGETDESLKLRLSTYDIDDDFYKYGSDTCKGRAAMFESGASLIRLRNIPEDNIDYSYLQHEIFHVVTFIMNRIGIPLQVQVSDEAYAYLIQYLTKEIYDRL